MRRARPIQLLTIGAVLIGTAACDTPPATTPYFDASSPPHEPRTDWRRVDPELRAAGIRLHVDIDDRPPTTASLNGVQRSLDVMATALEHLPAGPERAVVDDAARHIREHARSLENGLLDDGERRAVIKDALGMAVWAMMSLSDSRYALDPGVGERVGLFRDKVLAIEALDPPRVGVGRLDVYEALLGGRDALDGFLTAIANDRLRRP